jgi:hypothetical protein
MKCNICRQEYTPACDYKQGRCPHHKPMIDKPYPIWLLLLAAPFIIVTWMIMNPRKVWQQAKKDWKL